MSRLNKYWSIARASHQVGGPKQYLSSAPVWSKYLVVNNNLVCSGMMTPNSQNGRCRDRRDDDQDDASRPAFDKPSLSHPLMHRDARLMCGNSLFGACIESPYAPNRLLMGSACTAIRKSNRPRAEKGYVCRRMNLGVIIVAASPDHLFFRSGLSSLCSIWLSSSLRIRVLRATSKTETSSSSIPP
jgi:hypothetical protein